MKFGYLKYACLVGVMSMGTLPALAMQSVTVGHKSQVPPDAQLTEFVTAFRAAITANKPDFKTITAMLAPKINAFSRSLDPLAPWHKHAAITADHLSEIAAIIVEQGPPQDDVAGPDYRVDALAQMARIIGDGSNFGKIKEVPGAICAPAAWSYDVKAAKTFAASNDDQVSSLRFFASAKTMLAKPKASANPIGELPAFVPISFIYEKSTPDNWGKYISANGLTGYLQDDDAQLGFSQMHVCFGKVSGQYKVTGIFGYGL